MTHGAARFRSFALAFVIALLLTVLALSGTAQGAPEQRADINITKNSEFDAKHGVRSGSGTFRDPFVISGWKLGNLAIRNTDAYVDIFNNEISGTLTLNWIGDRVWVYRNIVNDLRVNQNVARTGDMTSGVISENKFNVVGQLRHWDGAFQHNVVGNPKMLDANPYSTQAVNFDGFNGAVFRGNTIFGTVDARLHGHHHSSSFESTSHYHGSHEAMAVDHTNRYHRVSIVNNTIHSRGAYALRYFDAGHAANDRTAASETNTALNAPHSHKTIVSMNGNQLIGAGLKVEIFNAADERHTAAQPGAIDMLDNRVVLFNEPYENVGDRYGIDVLQANTVVIRIARNRVEGPVAEWNNEVARKYRASAGIRFHTIRNAQIHVDGNVIERRRYGILASQMTKDVFWYVSDLSTSEVEKAIQYDTTVGNKPA